MSIHRNLIIGCVPVLMLAGNALGQGIPKDSPKELQESAPAERSAALSTDAQGQSFMGHRLGETLADYNGIEHTSIVLKPCKKHCEDARSVGKKWKLKDNKTDFLLSIRFYFTEDDKLKRVSIMPLWSELIGPEHDNVAWQAEFQNQMSLLTQKYGKPAYNDMQTYTNGFGARLDCRRLGWDFPDGSAIAALEYLQQRDIFFRIEYMNKAEFDKKSGQPRANPY